MRGRNRLWAGRKHNAVVRGAPQFDGRGQVSLRYRVHAVLRIDRCDKELLQVQLLQQATQAEPVHARDERARDAVLVQG